jgi:hypothetical protein
MTKSPYTYCVVRYLHDPTAGEMLNIGIVLRAPGVSYLGAQFDHHYERLSGAFAEFDGEHYRRTVFRFESAIESLVQGSTEMLFPLQEIPSDAGAVGAWLSSDPGLSIQFGPTLSGVTDDPARALGSLFARMVTSQYPKGRDRRTDDEVWVTYNRALARKSVQKLLGPARIVTENADLKFDHGFRNERWHLLQPLAFDLVTKEAIQGKAIRWLGNATALRDSPDLAKMYLLLGRPSLDANIASYNKAKNLLHTMPIEHELIEEEDADAFAAHLREYMRAHGLVRDDESK